MLGCAGSQISTLSRFCSVHGLIPYSSGNQQLFKPPDAISVFFADNWLSACGSALICPASVQCHAKRKFGGQCRTQARPVVSYSKTARLNRGAHQCSAVRRIRQQVVDILLHLPYEPAGACGKLDAPKISSAPPLHRFLRFLFDLGNFRETPRTGHKCRFCER